MSTVNVSGLCVVTVFATDLERSKAFYMNHLGFKEGDPMPPGIILRAGEITLYLEGGRKKREGAPLKQAELGFTFELREGLKEACAKFRDADVPLVGVYEEFSPSYGFFRIADPDGNVIEIAGKP
jgi:catechol 2,3-dioxygenase-like lactoylglutathione lyase family enzyme